MTLGDRFPNDVTEEARKHAAPMNLEGMELLFGGRRSDDKRLALAALPVLARVFERGLIEPIAKRTPAKAGSAGVTPGFAAANATDRTEEIFGR